MTNIYGNEPHDHDAGLEGAAETEHAEVHEAPSDYEFADHDSATSGHGDDQALPMSEAKVKGRSPLLPILAAVGGVILLGGVAWWQFSGSSAPETVPTAPLAMSAPIANSSSPSATLNNAQNTTPSNATPSLSVAPKVSASSSQDGLTPPPAAPMPTASEGRSQPDILAANTMPSNAPVSSPVVGPAVVPVQPMNPASTAPVIPSNAVVAPNSLPAGGSDQRIDALNSRIEDLQKSLNQITQQLSQVSNMVAAAPPPAAPSKDVQDRLERLEQQVAQGHHGAPTLSAPAALSVNDNAPVIIPKPTRLRESTHEARPVHNRTLAHKTSKVHKSAISEKEESAPRWVLRAAMPGQAWIADSPTAKDLKPLRVGDIVAGIGQITAIEPKDGNWIVRGTKGVIR